MRDPAAPPSGGESAAEQQPGGEREHDEQEVVAAGDPGDGLGQRRMGREDEPAEERDPGAVSKAQQQAEQQARGKRGEQDVRKW